ncbi:prolipoprotein diacylglyceryl transferase [bacterium]|nr:prolipoprotein diacylglyceryl transferase [bacterium]
MYPDLLKIPFFESLYIHTYGAMVALAFLAGTIWVYYESKRLGQDPDKGLDLVFYILIAAILGSRVLHVLVSERDLFLQNPLMILDVRSGLVFYGGVIGAVLAGWIYIRKHKLNFWLYVDIFAPGVPLGHMFGRIGCLSAGCCYGKAILEPHWWTIIFPPHEHCFAPVGIPLFPTQIVSSLANLCIFLGLFFLRKHKRFSGQMIATYMIVYGTFRIIIEEFRGDSVRGFIFDGLLSTSQFIAILMVLMGVTFYILRWNKKLEL